MLKGLEVLHREVVLFQELFAFPQDIPLGPVVHYDFELLVAPEHGMVVDPTVIIRDVAMAIVHGVLCKPVGPGIVHKYHGEVFRAGEKGFAEGAVDKSLVVEERVIPP